MGSAPLGWGLSGACACTSGTAEGFIGGELGLPSEARDPGEKFTYGDVNSPSGPALDPLRAVLDFMGDRKSVV